MARWDWYQATLHKAGRDEIGAALLRGFELADLAPGRPVNGYSNAAEVRRGDRVLATMFWGGNPGVHVKGTGEQAPTVRHALQGFEHWPTRVDACEDWIEAGLFDRMAEGLAAYAKANRIAINQQGDWVRGEARTLYLGSKQSVTRLVLYEKGYEAGGDLNWVRLEARIRPESHAKAQVATWVPDDAFRGSRWLCGALTAIGWAELQPHAVGTVWRPSDAERARRAMLHQYGATLRQWSEEVGGWLALAEVMATELDRPHRHPCWPSGAAERERRSALEAP